MTIDPAPSEDETAAILVALQRAYAASSSPQSSGEKTSCWRFAGRDYGRDYVRTPTRVRG